MCFLYLKKQQQQQTSIFRHWRMARSTSLHFPKNFMTLCYDKKQNNVHIPLSCEWGTRTCNRDAGSNVPQCDTASVEWSVHYICPSADVETSRGACWVKGLLECWGNTENHKQELISDSCTIFLSFVLSNLKCQTCSLYKRAVYSKNVTKKYSQYYKLQPNLTFQTHTHTKANMCSEGY